MIFGWNVNKILEHVGIILLNKPFSTRTAHELKSTKFVTNPINTSYFVLQKKQVSLYRRNHILKQYDFLGDFILANNIIFILSTTSLCPKLKSMEIVI